MDSHLHEQGEEDMEEYHVILYAGPSNDQFGLTADDDLEEDFRGNLSVEDVEESVRQSLERRSAREEEETREEEMERATEKIERGGAAPALHIEFEPTEMSVYVGELLLRSFLAATFACLSALLFTLHFFTVLLVVLSQFFVGPFVYYFLLALRFLFPSPAQTLEAPEPLPRCSSSPLSLWSWSLYSPPPRRHHPGPISLSRKRSTWSGFHIPLPLQLLRRLLPPLQVLPRLPALLRACQLLPPPRPCRR